MRRAIVFVLVFAALPVSGAPAPWPKTPRPDRRPDLEQLQGEWELDRIRRVAHRQTHQCEPGDVQLTISGRRYFINGRGGKGDEGLVTIDSTSRPKRIDFGWAHPIGDAPRELMDATTA